MIRFEHKADEDKVHGARILEPNPLKVPSAQPCLVAFGSRADNRPEDIACKIMGKLIPTSSATENTWKSNSAIVSISVRRAPAVHNSFDNHHGTASALSGVNAF